MTTTYGLILETLGSAEQKARSTERDAERLAFALAKAFASFIEAPDGTVALLQADRLDLTGETIGNTLRVSNGIATCGIAVRLAGIALCQHVQLSPIAEGGWRVTAGDRSADLAGPDADLSSARQLFEHISELLKSRAESRGAIRPVEKSYDGVIRGGGRR